MMKRGVDNILSKILYNKGCGDSGKILRKTRRIRKQQ